MDTLIKINEEWDMLGVTYPQWKKTLLEGGLGVSLNMQGYLEFALATLSDKFFKRREDTIIRSSSLFLCPIDKVGIVDDASAVRLVNILLDWFEQIMCELKDEEDLLQIGMVRDEVNSMQLKAEGKL